MTEVRLLRGPPEDETNSPVNAELNARVITKDERSATHGGNLRAMCRELFLRKVGSHVVKISGPKRMAVWVMSLNTEGHVERKIRSRR